MSKEKGSIANVLATGLCTLAMTVLVLVYMKDVELIYRKWQVMQLARKYILQMETTGYLEKAECDRLQEELELVGVTAVELEGSTVNPVGYGDTIVLHIKGYIGGEYAIEEERTSTAKY